MKKWKRKHVTYDWSRQAWIEKREHWTVTWWWHQRFGQWVYSYSSR